MSYARNRKYWFPAKRFGWGWGLPSAWQGWVVLLLLQCAGSLESWLAGDGAGAMPERLASPARSVTAAVSSSKDE